VIAITSSISPSKVPWHIVFERSFELWVRRLLMTTPLPAQSACSVPATSEGLRLVAKGQFDWAEATL